MFGLRIEVNIAGFDRLITLGERIMASIQDLKDTVAAEKAEVQAKLDSMSAQIDELKAIIAAGGNVTEAQLDEVKTAIEGIFTS